MKKKINRLIENQMKRLHKTLVLKLYDDRTWEELDKKCIELEIQIDKRNTIFLPLSRGIKLNGSVLISRDKYSNEEGSMDLSRIRVTAIDSAGKTFSCLTDRVGQFSLFLPMGVYILAINDAALGNKFVFVQSKMNLDLTHPIDNYSVTFNVAEKRRKMEIKKFNSEGELIK